MRTRIVLAEKMKYEKKRWTERAENRSTPDAIPALSLTPFSVCPRLGRRPANTVKISATESVRILIYDVGKMRGHVGPTGVRGTRIARAGPERKRPAREDRR